MPGPILIASMMREQGTTGVQTHVRAVLEALRQQQREVSLVTPFHNPSWQIVPVMGPRRLIEPLSAAAGVWWYRHWHARFLRQALRRALHDGRPCTIYAQCPPSARAALNARTSPRQKVVMVAHFNLSQADEWADKGAIARDGRLFRRILELEAAVLPAVDGLVFVSDFMRQSIHRRIPAVKAVPQQVVPNFVADPGAPCPPAGRRDLITVGTLEHRKNQRYALDIVHAAGQLGHPLSLTVVGDGPDRAMLEAHARALGIAQQVDFKGFVPDAAERMAAHRACLHTARMESFGIVLIEAMARGLPVFAPAVGGMTEVFMDGQEGRSIPLDDAPAAAHRVLEWLGNPQQLAAAGDAARSGFLARFEAGRTAARLLGFLDEVGQA